MTGAVAILERHLGLSPGAVGDRVIERAVLRRMKATGSATVADYLTRVAADRAELDELTEEAVVPETWFFRYPESFRHLAGLAAGRRKVRVLCVPCSTGEEPYSVAVSLLEAGFAPDSFRVEAADVSRRAVEAAKAGVYPPSAFRESGGGARDRYFEKTANGWAIRDAVRQAVGFRVANVIDVGFLAGEPPFDAVFCRNLLIYLTPDARRRVADAIDRLLVPGGVAYLGHVEPLGMIDPRFRAVGPPQVFAIARAEKRAAASRPTSSLIPSPSRLGGGDRGGGAGASHDREPSPSFGGRTPRSDLPTQGVMEPGQDGRGQDTKTTDHLLAARAAADRGDVAGALALAGLYMGDRQPTAEAFALVGALHATAGNLADAERAFIQALYLEPSHYDALVHLMVLADNRGDATAAANYRRRAARRGEAR